ncbi:uncharacterized protein M6B38_366960 [Iris pallida]|uniref:DUF8039 domain-containing protein n=1 Tax=Iris pallida TaxID=29817 RepID=A0AAX6GFY1_IRIPA|nr:uncharacterized protein M6B38_366960 [Iris pallida]
MTRKSARVIYDNPPISRLPPDSCDEDTDSASEENINVGGKKKKTRGKIKVPVVAVGENNRTMIEWNGYGQSVGKQSVRFNTAVGCIVRENVPININTWHNVDKRIKEKLWGLMMQKYVIEDCYKKFILRLMEKSWRNWKSSISRSLRKVVDAGVDVSRCITLLKPDEPTDRVWDEFVKIRTSDQFKELSQTKQAARAKQTMPYTLSRKGYARYEHDWKIENAGKSISRVDLWIEGHKKRKGENRGKPINDAAEKAISEMEKYKELPDSSTSINEDPVSKYFGPESSGSVRGLGFGVTPSKIEAQLQNKTWMQSVMNELNEVRKTQDLTQKILRELRPDMFPGEPSNGEALTPPSTQQVVAKAEIASTDSTSMVHHVILGPDCCKVWVKEVLVPDVTLFRASREFFTLDDTIGSTIAWPHKYISFEEIQVSTNRLLSS